MHLLPLAALLLTPHIQEPTPGADRGYTADWNSLSKHQAPTWFEEAKFGIFIHWGVYSVPSWCDTSTYSEWYRHWVETNAHDGKERRFHEEHYGADYPYERFAEEFGAELFDAAEWARIFRRAGAKYVVLTSKHHDGYCLWPSAEADAARGHAWNSVTAGPGRDLVGELSGAVRDEGLKMGLYYSFLEWANPLYDRSRAEYVEHVLLPQAKELITRYQPAIFWPDGEWVASDEEWRSKELLAWMYNHCENPEEFLVNDRWGNGLRAKTGDYYTTEYGMHAGEGATANERPWEECRGIGHSFAYNRAEGYDIYMSRSQAVQELLTIVGKGGTLLLDVGPTADGRIPLLMQDRLFAIGRWLDVHGESVYGTTAGPFASTPWGAATTKGDVLYLHLFEWPTEGLLVLPRLENQVLSAKLMHTGAMLGLEDSGGQLVVDLNGQHPHTEASVLRIQLDGPPSPDPRVHPNSEGQLVLHAALAELRGDPLRLETSRPGIRPQGVPAELLTQDTNAGYWVDPAASLAWRTAHEAGVRYHARAIVGVSPNSAGNAVTLRWGEEVTPSVSLASTGGWHDYVSVDLGTITAPSDAQEPLRLVTEGLQGEAIANVRGLWLQPVR